MRAPDSPQVLWQSLDLSVYAMVPPFYVDASITNNVWMEELTDTERQIDRPRFMQQWLRFYHDLAREALVFLVPPRQGLQDQCYLNSAAILPHVACPTALISNFTVPGRTGEEVAMRNFLARLGYACVPSPFRFEGEAELKYLRDNLYIGGYGICTQLQTHTWLEQVYSAQVIPFVAPDPYVYHLDCSVAVVSPDAILCYTALAWPETLQALEHVARVYPVTRAQAHLGVTNILRCRQTLYACTTQPYEDEREKLKVLEMVCGHLNLDLHVYEMSELAKSGALLSCCVLTLRRGF